LVLRSVVYVASAPLGRYYAEGRCLMPLECRELKTPSAPFTKDHPNVTVSRPWLPLVAPYQVPNTRKAVWQAASAFVAFAAVWTGMALSLRVHYTLALAFAIPAIGMMVRIFIIQHDCGHGSFTKSKRANNAIGFLCGVLTLTPYAYWRYSHAVHHATASQLENRGIGDVWTLTIGEYAQLPRWRRLHYRLIRSAFFLFFIAPLAQFVLLQRVPWNGPWRWTRRNADILWTDLALVVLYGALIHWIGWKSFLILQLPLIALMGAVGMLLFYVQHQFDHTYWAKSADWDYETAALRGCSYFRLPRVLQWFTGNIGFHHIHHLSHRIPNYNLQRCHDENPRFQNVNVVTLRTCLHTFNLKLWDEERQLLVSFRDAARRLQARTSATAASSAR